MPPPDDRTRLLHMLEAAHEAVIGMRNKLVHAYFEIDLDRVWATTRKNLPELVEQLEAELGPRPS